MLDLVEKFTCEFVRTEVHTRLFSTIPNQEKKKKVCMMVGKRAQPI